MRRAGPASRSRDRTQHGAIDGWFAALARRSRDREAVSRGFASPCAHVAMLSARCPGVRPADVERASGMLHPPSGAQLAVVGAVDPLGVRRREFAPLARHRTHDIGTGCGC